MRRWRTLQQLGCAALLFATSRGSSPDAAAARELRELGEFREFGKVGGPKDLYHPGHAAVHVTRLHRYDHSGLGVFLERESEWHAGGTPRSGGGGGGAAASTAAGAAGKAAVAVGAGSDAGGAGAGGGGDGGGAGASDGGGITRSRRLGRSRHKAHAVANQSLTGGGTSRFLRLSSVQAASLRHHQQAWLQRAVSAERDDAESGRHGSAGQRYRERKEALLRPDAVQSEALERYALAHTGARSGRAVTALSSLYTQYVGPIGVGTTLVPDGCRMPSGSLLHLQAEHAEEALGVDEEGAATCQATDQSKIWVVFDTGSTNIWVASDLCERGACTKPGRQRYNHTQSLTFDYPKSPARLTVEFGTGKLAGPQGVDDFHIGPFSVFQQTFGMIESQSGDVFEDVPFEGILGLAFPSMSANKVRPFFDTVVDQKALQHNEFAFYFSHNSPTANAIFWGGVDPRFYKGEIEYFKVVDPYYWAVSLLAFSVGDDCLLGARCGMQPEAGYRSSRIGQALLEVGHHAGGQNFRVVSSDTKTKARRRAPSAIIDTGTTYFTAEGYLFDELMLRIPPAPCNEITDESHPPLTYTLKNVAGEMRDFTFTNDMYMARDEEDTTLCSPAFMRIDIPAKHGPAMVLGEVFLRHYYAVFDRGENGSDAEGLVGLAPSQQTEEAIHAVRHLTHEQPSFQATRDSKLAKSIIRRSAGGQTDGAFASSSTGVL